MVEYNYTCQCHMSVERQHVSDTHTYLQYEVSVLMRKGKETKLAFFAKLLVRFSALLTRHPWPTPRRSHLFPVHDLCVRKATLSKKTCQLHLHKKIVIYNRTYHWSSCKITSKLKPIYLWVKGSKYSVTNDIMKTKTRISRSLENTT